METKEKDNKAKGAESPKEGKVVEIGKNLPAVIKPDLTLPQTIKTVEMLHKMIMHRDRLEFYATELQNFQLKKRDEDLEATNYYSGCKIEITDDSNHKFSLKHPGVIMEVVEFMAGRFNARRVELEGEIKLPSKKVA